MVLLHGAFGGGWAWCDGFAQRLAAAGFHCYVPSLRAHGGSPARALLDTASLADYVQDLETVIGEVIARVGAAPAVVAHSLGGLVAQKLLERRPLPALALLAPVPPQGLLPVMPLIAARHPRVFVEILSLIHTGLASREGVREALFADGLDAERLERYYGLVQRESLRAVWDAALFDLPNPHSLRRVPMLVMGAAADRLIAPEMVRLCARTLGAPCEIVPGMGHAMMLDRGWEGVADRLAAWLGTAAAG